MKKETQDIHVYFPKEMHEALKRLAETNRRSLSAEVIIAVEKHINKELSK